MTIDEIILSDFGSYRGEQTLRLFPPNPEQPVVLLGGMNGTGKTTLLDSIKLALYGKRANCSNRGATRYHELLRRLIHRSADPKKGAFVEVAFRSLSEGDEQNYRVRRSWHQNGKGLVEEFAVDRNGKPDRFAGENWSEVIEELIPAQIAHLFFFDGERIETLADPEKSSKLLAVAIHSLLGLDLVDQLQTDLVVLERRKRLDIKDESARRKIEALVAEAEQLEGRRRELTQELAAANNIIDRQRKKLREVEEEFRLQGGVLLEEREQLEARRSSFQEQLRFLEEEARALAAGDAPLLLVRNLLSKVDSQARKALAAQAGELVDSVLRKRDKEVLKRADSLGASSEILRELSSFFADDRRRRREESQCICRLSLDDRSISAISEFLLPDGGRASNRIRRLMEEASKVKALLGELDRNLAAVPDREAVGHLVAQREEVKGAVEIARIRVERLEQDIEKLNRILEQKKAQLVRQLESRVEEEFEREDVQRVITHSQRVRHTLKEFRSQVVARHVERIEQTVLRSFQQLLHKDSLISNLRIDPATFAVHLRNSAGQEVPAGLLSAGERQLLAVSLLWGLAQASGRPLPAIIDTPLGRLDSSHRRHLVERYFPYASHQVLLLSTDVEIHKDYYQKLSPWIGRSYMLDFDDKSSGTQIREGYFWSRS